MGRPTYLNTRPMTRRCSVGEKALANARHRAGPDPCGGATLGRTWLGPPLPSRRASVNGHRFLPTGGHLIPHWWPWFLPTGGHQIPPPVAIVSPQRDFGSRLAEGFDPLAGGGLREP